jgi:antirestriction protein ArdC
VIERGFSAQSWLTFRHALGLGGHVRKGEQGNTVVYADRFTPEDERRRAARGAGSRDLARSDLLVFHSCEAQIREISPNYLVCSGFSTIYQC